MASVIKCAGCGRCVRTLKNGYEKELLELQKWGKRDNCLFCKNSNNWKRMHGVPLKAHPRLNGYRICSVRLDNRYVSKRSRKKQKKIRFRGCFFYQITEAGLHDNPKLQRIYYRYGAWRKKLRKKTSRKGGD